MRLISRLFLVLAVALLSGCVVATVSAELSNREWVSLGTPPQPAESILATSPNLIVESATGSRYQSTGDSSWAPFEDVDIPSPSLTIEECPNVEPPRMPGSHDLSIECEYVGVQAWERAYAIADSGEVVAWERYIGEWAGAANVLTGLTVSVVVFALGSIPVIAISFKDQLASMQASANQRMQKPDDFPGSD